MHQNFKLRKRSINAEENFSSDQPSIFSMKNQPMEPTKNQPIPSKEPTNIQQEAIREPLTRREEGKEKEEYKKATTSAGSGDVSLYKCLEKAPNLTLEEKITLLKYPEDRIEKAIEWTSKAKVKTTLIQTLHWHCKQATPPLIPESPSMSQNDPQTAAWEYNLFLKSHGYETIAAQNQKAISQHFAYIVSSGQTTTISLKNPIEIVRIDFTNSMNEVLAQKGVHHG